MEELDEINKELDTRFKQIITENNPLEYFGKLICPEIAGNDDVKKAILLMLVSKDSLPGIRNRIHIGLVGLPGTGKTVFMEHLEREHGAFYFTADTKTSTLKGDARKQDYGVQVFKMANGGIVCFDEIELMEDKETLRDVMEKGEVIYSKGGKIERYPAKIRTVIGSNEFKKLSIALVDRLDFVFKFIMPSRDEAKEIARKIVSIYAGRAYIEERKILIEYLEWVGGFEPKITADEEVKITELFDNYFDMLGEGRSGRWVAKVMRIAIAHAKLYKRDVLTNDVRIALKMTNHNGKSTDTPATSMYRKK